MDRRVFLGTLAGGLLAGPLAEAQQPGKFYQIGFLAPRPIDATPFRQGMRERGYIERRDFAIEFRYAEEPARLAAFAAELVQLRPDVIVTAGTAATLAAKRATSAIPIVFGSAGSPVERGLVASLGRPGGNVTGLALHLGSKPLELLKEAAPAVSKVAFVYDPGNRPTIQPEAETLTTIVRHLGIEVQSMPVRDVNEVERMFPDAVRAGANGLLVANDALLVTRARRIATLAMQYRLPAVYYGPEFVHAGGLLGYGENLAEMYRRAAIYVDKILKGAKPADLPVEQPATFELVINLKTARALGLTIPPSLLQRADQVIE